MKYSTVYVATVVPFTFCTMASNIAHPFLWNILGYFVFNFLCSTKQKTGRMFTHKHIKHLSNHQSGWMNCRGQIKYLKKYFIYVRQNFYLNFYSENLTFNNKLWVEQQNISWKIKVNVISK